MPNFSSQHFTKLVEDRGYDRQRFRQEFIRRCTAVENVVPSDATIWRWFDRDIEPSGKYLILISEMLGIPVDAIYLNNKTEEQDDSTNQTNKAVS